MYFVFWLGRLMTRSTTLSWINLQHNNIAWWRPAVSGQNIRMNSGVSLVRHKITELMHNYPPTTAITTIAIRLGRQDEMNGVLWFVCFKGQDKKRTRIWVSKKRNFPDIASEQSQRTECKQKLDCFSCVQRMQLNANVAASGLVSKKSRVTIMMAQRLFRQRRENR